MTIIENPWNSAGAITQAGSRSYSIPMGKNTAGSSGDANAPTIAANDFLTLLVAEMKNQDPTAQTDPNEYINQLVQVNSLEQLIEINQTLSSAAGSPQPNLIPRSSTAVSVPWLQASTQRPSTPPESAPDYHAIAGGRPPASKASVDSPMTAIETSTPPNARSAAQRLALSLSGSLIAQ